MLSWFEFRRRNEARWDRLIDAAVEARHHGVTKPQRPIRTWAPTALAAVALAGVGGMAGHTLATPTAISVASAAESSSIDGASTSVPGRADDPVNDASTDAGRDASEVGASADPDADGAGAAGSAPGDAPSSPPGGAGPGAGDDASGAGEPTVIGPIIAGDTAIGPITVTRGPQGPEVVGEVPVEEGDTGGGSGIGGGGAGGGASTVTATPAPSGDAAPDDDSGPDATGGRGGSSTPTSGANPGSDAGAAREGESSSPKSGSAPSGAARGTGAGDAGGDDDEPGSGSSAGEQEPGGPSDADAAGQDGQDEDGEQCATTAPGDDATEGSGSSGSAGASGDGGSAPSSGSGNASSSTSAAPDGSRSDLSRGADQEPYDEPDQGGGSSTGPSGSSESGAAGGSGTGEAGADESGADESGAGAPADSAEGTEQQERAGEDGAGECADDGAGAGASEDDGGVAGKATDALFSLTGVEGFDLGQGGNVENGEVPAEAPSPNVPGHTAVKMELPAGGKRSEVRPQEVAQDIKAGQKMFFGYSAFLPEDFPTDATDFQVVWQLHSESSTSSPPLALEVQQGKLWLANVGELVEDLGPVSPGENVTVQMGIDFEVGGGSVTVWRDGEEILTDFQPPRGTMIDNLNYLKTGLYRREEGSPASSLFLNDMKVGDTLESVSGLAGGPTATQESGVAGALGSTTGALLGGVLPVAGMRWRRRRMEW